MAGIEAVESGNQPGRREERRHENAQPAAPCRCADALDCVGDLLEGVCEAALQAPAVGRETDTAAFAGEEGHADIVLEVADLAADCARRNREFGSGGRDRFQAGDGMEGAQRVEGREVLDDPINPINSFSETDVAEAPRPAVQEKAAAKSSVNAPLRCRLHRQAIRDRIVED